MPTKVKTKRKTKAKTGRTRAGEVYVKGFYKRKPRRRTSKPKPKPNPVVPAATTNQATPAATDPSSTDPTKDPSSTDPTKDSSSTDPTAAAAAAKGKDKDKKKGTWRYKFTIFLLLVAIGVGVYFSINKNPPSAGGGGNNVGGGGWVTKGTASAEWALDGTIGLGIFFFVVATGLSVYRLRNKDYAAPGVLRERATAKAEEMLELGEGEVETGKRPSTMLEDVAGHSHGGTRESGGGKGMIGKAKEKLGTGTNNKKGGVLSWFGF